MGDDDGCAGCGLMVVLLLALAFFWAKDAFRKSEEAQKARMDSVAVEAARAKTRIGISEVDVEDVALRGSMGVYTLVGRVRNRSNRYTLTELELVVKIIDCTARTQCDIVGQQSEVLYTNVPPGQTRGLEKSVYFLDLPPPRGRFTFTHSIVSISGK